MISVHCKMNHRDFFEKNSKKVLTNSGNYDNIVRRPVRKVFGRRTAE